LFVGHAVVSCYAGGMRPGAAMLPAGSSDREKKLRWSRHWGGGIAATTDYGEL
jgi:hypothetical protein